MSSNFHIVDDVFYHHSLFIKNEFIDPYKNRVDRQRSYYDLCERYNSTGVYRCGSYLKAEYEDDMRSLGVTEESIQHTFSTLYPSAICEFNCGWGNERADLNYKNSIIEIKKISVWKHGLGQLMGYRYLKPEHESILILLGSNFTGRKVDYIRKVCSHYSVKSIFIDTSKNNNQQLNYFSHL